MKPYVPDTNKGRVVARDDIHHRTADQPRKLAERSAKAARHSARQQARVIITKDENPKSV